MTIKHMESMPWTCFAICSWYLPRLSPSIHILQVVDSRLPRAPVSVKQVNSSETNDVRALLRALHGPSYKGRG